MHVVVTRDSASGRNKCLACHLPAKYSLAIFIRTEAPKDVFFKGFKIQQVNECVYGRLIHLLSLAANRYLVGAAGVDTSGTMHR